MQRLPLIALLTATLLATGACRPDRSQDPAPTPPANTRGDDTPEPAVKPLRTTTGKPRATEPKKPAAKEPSAESGRLAGITAAHNRVRARLKIADLTWSPELASFAQAWADKLARQGCKLRHRPRSGADAQRYGENIFSMTGDTPTADAVVDAWAGEVKDYDARTDRCKGVCGHYTQVVWRKSQRLGCGMAACGDTEVWVCNYDPRGNYDGERPY